MPSDFLLGIQSATGHAGGAVEPLAGVNSTVDVVPGISFLDWFQMFSILDGGAVPYTTKITIDRTDTAPIRGAFIRLQFNVAASTDPTIEIRDDTAVGTLLQTFSGVADETRTFLFEGVYDGAAWTKYDGRIVI